MTDPVTEEAVERVPLPLGSQFIDEAALDRWRAGASSNGHAMVANQNTVWRLVATIDYFRAALTKSPPVTVSEVEQLRGEILRLVDALKFAHDAGFEWPVDPLPFGSIAHNLFIERGNERISE